MKEQKTTHFTRLFTSTLLSFTLAFTALAGANDFSKLTIMTEDFPPFNYNQDGKVAGSAVDLLIQASAAAGKPIANNDINLMNWARAYKAVQSGPNALLFSMTRTESRENLFKWAGPIGENRVVIWAKKSSGIAPFDNIKDNALKVGVVRDTVGDQLMMTAGASDNGLMRNSKPEGAAKMLISDRMKLWAYSENSGAQQLIAAGANVDDYEIVHVLKASQLFFAFSKDVDDSVVQLLQQGIDKVNK